MISEEIDYKAGTTALKGFLASGAERKPALLIAHEAPGLSQHTRDIAVRAAETGYVAFAVDYLGAGRMLTEMQAVMEQVPAWVSDPWGLRQGMKAAHDVLLARSDIDPARIGGMGYSFGGQALIEYTRTGANKSFGKERWERVIGEIAAKQNRPWPASQPPDPIVLPPLR